MPGRSDSTPWRRWTLVEENAGRGNESEETERRDAGPDPLAQKDERIAELTEDLRRIQADFENYKKRVDKDSAERSKMANQRFMADLLPVLDSFDKALEEMDGPDNSPHRKGLEGLHKQLLQTLQREGLREITAEGRFDPFLHEALMREEREDVEEGQILEVYQKGYQVGSRPIRPAKVKVASRALAEAKSERDEVQDNRRVESQDNDKYESR